MRWPCVLVALSMMVSLVWTVGSRIAFSDSDRRPHEREAPAEVRREIQAEYRAMEKAVSRRHAEGYMALFDRDCKVTRKDKSGWDRLTLRGEVDQLLSRSVNLRLSVKVKDCKMQPDGTVTAEIKEHFNDVTTDSEGRRHSRGISCEAHDTWKKIGKAWKLVARQLERTEDDDHEDDDD